MEYINHLIKHCELAKSAKPIRKFTLNDLSELADIKTAIYIVSEVGGDRKKTFDDFSSFKKTTDRRCSKLNHPSSVLYVGSSTTDLTKRIKQHMGEGHKSTYSLHMKHWFGKRRAKISIIEYDVARPVLQIIEDAISYKLLPAFGKHGGNSTYRM